MGELNELGAALYGVGDCHLDAVARVLEIPLEAIVLLRPRVAQELTERQRARGTSS